MARRRRRKADRLSFLSEAYLRVAGTIILDTLAFSIWNVGSRSPARALREIRAHIAAHRSVVAGLLRALIGLIFVLAGGVLLIPAIVNPRLDLAPFQIFAIIVALGLEHFVGADIRALADPGYQK